MKDKTFDINVSIDVKVLPRDYEDTATQTEWHHIENRVNWNARLLAKGLEKYFESLVLESINSSKLVASPESKGGKE